MQLEEDENEAGQNDSPAKSKNQQGPAIQDRIKRVKKESGLSTYTLSKRLDLAFEVVEKIIYGINHTNNFNTFFYN